MDKKTIEEIKTMNLSDIIREINQFRQTKPEEYRAAQKNTTGQIELKDGLYHAFCKGDTPSKEEYIRMEYACLLLNLNKLDLGE